MEEAHKNPVCAITWRDAFYSFAEEPPKECPLPNVTVGFIVEENERYVNIATNVLYERKDHTITPIDGLVIPRGCIIAFEKLSYFDAEEE